MKVLLLGYGKAPVRYKYMSNYCENFLDGVSGGHEVLTFGYSEGVDILIEPADPFSTVVDKLPEGWTPDFCLLREVEWNLLPFGIEDAPFPVVTLTFDWDYDIPPARTFVEMSDLIISVSEREKELLRAVGARNIEIFHPIGIMREFAAPSPRKMRDRKYDILYTTFVDDLGHPDRSRFIMKLCTLSDRYSVHIPDQVRDYDAYLDLLRDSRLVLSHHRFGSMSGRIFEASVQGTVVLETGKEVAKYFTPHEEYIPVTEDDILDQVAWYIENRDHLQGMSDRVYAKVIDRFEARKRFTALLDFVGEIIARRTGGFVRPFKGFSKAVQCGKRGEVYYYQYFKGVSGEGFLNINKSAVLELGVDQLRKALECERSPMALVNLATAKACFAFLYNSKGSSEEIAREVVPLLEQSIAEYPSYVMAHFQLGLLYWRMAELEKALDTFRQTLKLMDSQDAVFDPWCLYNVDFRLFNQLLRRSINVNLLAILSDGERGDAPYRHKNCYKAAILYLMSVIQVDRGQVHDALANLFAAHKLDPHSGPIASLSARIASLLGYAEEGLSMFETAVRLMPFDIHLRMEYCRVLYYYNMDLQVHDQLTQTRRILKTVKHLEHFLPLFREIGFSLSRYKDGPLSFHDFCAERLLLEWIDTLNLHLNKSQLDFRIVFRLVVLLDEIGRTQKAFDMAESFVGKCMAAWAGAPDPESVSKVKLLYGHLESMCGRKGGIRDEKLKRLKNKIDGIRVVNRSVAGLPG